MHISEVPIEQIVVGANPREAPGDTTDLQASIRELGNGTPGKGLIQPITLWATGEEWRTGQPLQLIAGQRRLTACRALGWKTIPAVIWTTPEPPGPDEQAAALLASNVYRPPTPLQEARGVQALMLQHKWTITRAARAIGKDTRHVRALLRLLEAPEEVKQAVDDGTVTVRTYGHLGQLRKEEQAAVLADVKERTRDDTGHISGQLVKTAINERKGRPVEQQPNLPVPYDETQAIRLAESALAALRALSAMGKPTRATAGRIRYMLQTMYEQIGALDLMALDAMANRKEDSNAGHTTLDTTEIA